MRFLANVVALALGSLGQACSRSSQPPASKPLAGSDSLTRETRSLTVGTSAERWALMWTSPPAPACTPETDSLWMTCPCVGFAFGEQGHAMLVRRRAGLPDQRLGLDSLFDDAPTTRRGLAVLERWPASERDYDSAGTPGLVERVRAHAPAQLMDFADYDHDGQATEFTLKVGNAACGHDEVVLLGVSPRHPTLHVFGTVLHPQVPLKLQSADWQALRRSGGDTTVVEWACGDHGASTELDLHLSAGADGIRADSLMYECSGPRGERGRLRSKRAF